MNNEPSKNGNEPVSTEDTSLVKELLSWLEVIVVAVVLAFLLVTFIIVNATVPSGSMENTIMPGNRLLGLRLTSPYSSILSMRPWVKIPITLSG